jgi:hypothetical protein
MYGDDGEYSAVHVWLGEHYGLVMEKIESNMNLSNEFAVTVDHADDKNIFSSSASNSVVQVLQCVHMSRECYRQPSL